MKLEPGTVLSWHEGGDEWRYGIIISLDESQAFTAKDFDTHSSEEKDQINVALWAKSKEGLLRLSDVETQEDWFFTHEDGSFYTILADNLTEFEKIVRQENWVQCASCEDPAVVDDYLCEGCRNAEIRR